MSCLTAISPVDGRYAEKLAALRPLCSEYGLIKQRIIVEIRWFQWLMQTKAIKELPVLSPQADQYLHQLIVQFDEQEAQYVKSIEQTTNHDVKAVEYYLKEKWAAHPELAPFQEFIHFACTSEDINNLAYGLICQAVRNECLLPAIQNIISQLRKLAKTYATQPMMARTHGQPASPTTVGKEFANFIYRLDRQYQSLITLPILGKFNGAVGNFNAHYAAYPHINWPVLAQQFVEQLGLQWNPYTTQIEPHDYLAELAHNLQRLNTILIDLARDLWGYISLNYFSQRKVEQEVGSSTMPHKINPIDFENAEGNLGIANALFTYLAQQLPTSRWQRDLVDSTVLRNVGVAFAHSLLAYQALSRGLAKLVVNPESMTCDLANHWELLAEPLQTVMRRYGIPNSYEKLKALTRGKTINQTMLHQFIDTLELPLDIKKELKSLTPQTYLGNAVKQAQQIE